MNASIIITQLGVSDWREKDPQRYYNEQLWVWVSTGSKILRSAPEPNNIV